MARETKLAPHFHPYVLSQRGTTGHLLTESRRPVEAFFLQKEGKGTGDVGVLVVGESCLIKIYV